MIALNPYCNTIYLHRNKLLKQTGYFRPKWRLQIALVMQQTWYYGKMTLSLRAFSSQEDRIENSQLYVKGCAHDWYCIKLAYLTHLSDVFHMPPLHLTFLSNAAEGLSKATSRDCRSLSATLSVHCLLDIVVLESSQLMLEMLKQDFWISTLTSCRVPLRNWYGLPWKRGESSRSLILHPPGLINDEQRMSSLLLLLSGSILPVLHTEISNLDSKYPPIFRCLYNAQASCVGGCDQARICRAVGKSPLHLQDEPEIRVCTETSPAIQCRRRAIP